MMCEKSPNKYTYERTHIDSLHYTPALTILREIITKISDRLLPQVHGDLNLTNQLNSVYPHLGFLVLIYFPSVYYWYSTHFF